ncbi:MAG TPA: hypothetical protein VIP09_01060 [Dehalococcoidia bacterium]|jgi:hypothetical protein
MGNCLACAHELERHLFGGMCFYCDCKRAVVDTTAGVFLGAPDTKTKPSTNGTGKRKKSGTPRLGNT